MATILERPLSALSDLQNNIQRNSRRGSIEIIDVEEYTHNFPQDASMAGPSSSRRNTRPLPRPVTRHASASERETIFVSDNDEDDEVQIISAGEHLIHPL